MQSLSIWIILSNESFSKSSFSTDDWLFQEWKKVTVFMKESLNHLLNLFVQKTQNPSVMKQCLSIWVILSTDSFYEWAIESIA